MAKKRMHESGIVYSTDPEFKTEVNLDLPGQTLSPANQRMHIQLDKKQRAGKAVTLVEGFTGSSDQLEALGKQLKITCGTGGSVKDGIIIVQGDNRDKIFNWLVKQGYLKTRKY